MIYASFSNAVKSEIYEDICAHLDIPTGEGAEKRRTPMESRIAHRVLYAINSGRGGVLVNFNTDACVIIDPSAYRKWVFESRLTPAVTRLSSIRWEVVPYRWADLLDLPEAEDNKGS